MCIFCFPVSFAYFFSSKFELVIIFLMYLFDVQVLSISVLLLACSQDWARNH